MEMLRNIELESNQSNRRDTDDTFRKMTHLHMHSHVSVSAGEQGCLPEERSSLVVGEEGWLLVAVPVGLEVQELEEPASALSPAAAAEWVCSPGNTGPGSDGRYLQHKRGAC